MKKNYTKRRIIAKTWCVGLFFAIGLKVSAQDCAAPQNLTTANLGVSHAEILWQDAEGLPANGYEWQIKLAGSQEVLQTGTAANAILLVTQLQPETEYDVEIRALCSETLYSGWVVQNITTLPLVSSREGQIGVGASANIWFDACYSPIMYAGIAERSGSVSNILFTAAEMQGINIPAGAVITSVAFEKINAAYGGDEFPDLRLRMFARNSETTAPLSTQTTFANILESHTEVMDNPAYDLPATIGWIDFAFDEPFEYTGQGLELATAMYQNAQRMFNTHVIWQYTSGYSDYIIGSWPILTVPMSENLVLSHASYKNRPNIKIFYNVPNAVTAIDVATSNNAAAEITENQGALQLTSSILPAYVSQATVWQIVSGAEFATLSQNGVLSAFANGTVTVRAIAADDSELYDEITISITNQRPCDVSFPGSAEPITLVQFAGIDNASAATIGDETPQYENFDNITAQVALGQQYPITVKGNTNGNFVHHVTAYVDWNRNNNFEDEGEQYTIGTIEDSTGEDEITVAGNITVPQDAPLGLTKIRILKKFNTEAPSCNTVGYGQAEDYSINVNSEIASVGGFKNTGITIYPNPTEGLITLQHSGQQIKFAEVYNSLGQPVLKTTTQQLNLSQLQNGIYILKVHLNTGETQSFKIIKK
ncbi:GEVED domain-containing protein [Flavobacterium sp. Sd200]|uniref:GEVED domain-containing protein n=1 Tax=Flavobacterium sp. Sd200 TaxID=2692211 RepID=UPI00136A68DB|nr:GEVED domain-containing protein [Flavobacterium sp. Sd200]